MNRTHKLERRITVKNSENWRNVGIIAFVIFAATSAAYAQDLKPSPTTGLSPGDIKQIQDAATGIKEVFGIENPPTATSTPVANGQVPPSQKTIADVADKAVDMVGRMVATTAETLQKVAPDVWRIMIKQQYAKAAGDLIIPVGLIIVMLIVDRAYLRRYRQEVNRCAERECTKQHDHEDTKGDECEDVCRHDHSLGRVVGWGLPGVAYTTGSLWFLVALSYSIKYLINPEFYAVRDMLMMLLNKGQTM